MPRWCEDVTLENGTRAIFCHSGRRPAPWLCDYVLEFGMENPTCDRPMCNEHRVKMGKDIDYCLEHARIDKKKPLGPERGPETPAEIEAMEKLQRGENVQ